MLVAAVGKEGWLDMEERAAIVALVLTNMFRVEIDVHAKEKATKQSGFPPCLHVPIAARDEDAIQRFIGTISRVLNPGTPNQALLVHTYETPILDLNLPIWRLNEAAIFHKSDQVWVHVDFDSYREAYKSAFPNENIDRFVLDHILNRRVARLKRFNYLRIIPISRGSNSSSGGVSETYGFDYHSTPEMVERNRVCPTFIQYADLADIVKMLDLKTGGTLQDGVRDAIYLVEPEKIK
jgi:hypothetical protein